MSHLLRSMIISLLNCSLSALSNSFIPSSYPVYTEQDYLDHDPVDTNLDRNPKDVPVYTDIHCSI